MHRDFPSLSVTSFRSVTPVTVTPFPIGESSYSLQAYAKEYVAGDRAHTDEDYEVSVGHMERAVDLYWEAMEDCRIMCEEPFDQGWFPDFMSSVASEHYHSLSHQ